MKSLIIRSNYLKQDPETGEINQCYSHNPALSMMHDAPSEEPVTIHVLDQYYENDQVTKRVWYPGHKASFEVDCVGSEELKTARMKDIDCLRRWFLPCYGLFESHLCAYKKNLSKQEQEDCNTIKKLVLSTPFPQSWKDDDVDPNRAYRCTNCYPLKRVANFVYKDCTWGYFYCQDHKQPGMIEIVEQIKRQKDYYDSQQTMGALLEQLAGAYFARGDYGCFSTLMYIDENLLPQVSVETAYRTWKSKQMRCKDHRDKNDFCLQCCVVSL